MRIGKARMRQPQPQPQPQQQPQQPQQPVPDGNRSHDPSLDPTAKRGERENARSIVAIAAAVSEQPASEKPDKLIVDETHKHSDAPRVPAIGATTRLPYRRNTVPPHNARSSAPLVAFKKLASRLPWPSLGSPLPDHLPSQATRTRIRSRTLLTSSDSQITDQHSHSCHHSGLDSLTDSVQGSDTTLAATSSPPEHADASINYTAGNGALKLLKCLSLKRRHSIEQPRDNTLKESSLVSSCTTSEPAYHSSSLTTSKTTCEHSLDQPMSKPVTTKNIAVVDSIDDSSNLQSAAVEAFVATATAKDGLAKLLNKSFPCASIVRSLVRRSESRDSIASFRSWDSANYDIDDTSAKRSNANQPLLTTIETTVDPSCLDSKATVDRDSLKCHRNTKTWTWFNSASSSNPCDMKDAVSSDPTNKAAHKAVTGSPELDRHQELAPEHTERMFKASNRKLLQGRRPLEHQVLVLNLMMNKLMKQASHESIDASNREQTMRELGGLRCRHRKHKRSDSCPVQSVGPVDFSDKSIAPIETACMAHESCNDGAYVGCATEEEASDLVEQEQEQEQQQSDQSNQMQSSQGYKGFWVDARWFVSRTIDMYPNDEDDMPSSFYSRE